MIDTVCPLPVAAPGTRAETRPLVYSTSGFGNAPAVVTPARAASTPAAAALRVAEAAYRYGERGIIDYLDAQRALRTARNDLIAAQFDLHVAAIEIERLLATSSTGNNP